MHDKRHVDIGQVVVKFKGFRATNSISQLEDSMPVAQQTNTLIHIAATTMFSILLVVAMLLSYYAYLTIWGDGGGSMVDAITWGLERRQTALALIGAAATAIPALALGLANTRRGDINRRGWIYVSILAPTWVLATVTNFILEPKDINLGSGATPLMADATALSISGLSLTYLAAILGFKRLMGSAAQATAADPAPSRKKAAIPPEKDAPSAISPVDALPVGERP